MNTDLHPIYCPLCGSERLYVYEDKAHPADSMISCGFCNLTLSGYVSLEALMKRWNHRFDPSKK